ncbi:MAG: dCTP deaminase [bacterium]|nr:dCTP deaminase [bacterium]
MSILAKSALLKEIKANRIKINPFRAANMGPASYDLTLGNEFRIFKKQHYIYEATEKSDYREVTELIKTNKPFTLMPGELVHAITQEIIILPNDICGWLQGRSRFARLGLLVHITAAFMQPGINNRQVLELFNASPFPLSIRPGLRICQFIFQRCEGQGTYRGRFQNQKL